MNCGRAEAAELGPERACGSREREGVAKLAEDFVFAEDHGVEAGGNAEEMLDRSFAAVGVVEIQKGAKYLGIVGERVDLDAIARGEDEAFGYERAEALGVDEGEALAHGQWRGAMVDADDYDARRGCSKYW
jgi:hypothetical protein